MHDKPTVPAKTNHPTHPLRALSLAEFAELGTESVVFARHMSGRDLARLVPEAAEHADDPNLVLVLSASGQPLLVTDGFEAVSEWLEDKPLHLATVH